MFVVVCGGAAHYRLAHVTRHMVSTYARWDHSYLSRVGVAVCGGATTGGPHDRARKRQQGVRPQVGAVRKDGGHVAGADALHGACRGSRLAF